VIVNKSTVTMNSYPLVSTKVSIYNGKRSVQLNKDSPFPSPKEVLKFVSPKKVRTNLD